jgi:hypothetical protein
MFKGHAKFVSAVFASFLAAAALVAMSCNTARAAEECLAGPKAQTPQGGHWYYYIDHPTKRHCWYLGEEHGTVSRTASPNSSPSAAPDSQKAEAATSQKAEAATSQKAEAAMQPSVANARAELPAQSTVEQPNRDAAPAPAMPTNATIWENGAPSAQRSLVASRWPDQSEPTTSPADPAPDKPDSTTAQNSTARSEPPTPIVAQVAAATSLSEASTYSMPMQLAALMGALAIAGIIGSVVFRFSGSRRAVRVHADPRRPDFSRASYDADDRDERIAEFFAELSRLRQR